MRDSQHQQIRVKKTAAKMTGIFVASSGGRLTPQRTLVETLSINQTLLRRNGWQKDRQDLRLFVGGAEEAWGKVREQIIAGRLHFIQWLRQLLTEAHECKLWIPKIFFKRLGQLQRREIVFVAGPYSHDPIPFDGLPQAFADCCKFCGMEQSKYVPSLHKGEFEPNDDSSQHSRQKATRHVKLLVAVWKRHPTGLARADLVQWIHTQVAQAYRGSPR